MHAFGAAQYAPRLDWSGHNVPKNRKLWRPTPAGAPAACTFMPWNLFVIDLLRVIALGIIEGITEFLPISITGHLLIAEKLGWALRSDLFNVGIQAGAILAVTLIYWTRIWQLLTQWRDPANRDYLLKLIVAFLITAVLGLIAVKMGFQLPKTVTPDRLGAGHRRLLDAGRRGAGRASAGPPGNHLAVAILVGIAQMVAGIFPGTSRSAATIFTAMLFGTSNRPPATEFAFLVGIPDHVRGHRLRVAQGSAGTAARRTRTGSRWRWVSWSRPSSPSSR